MLEESQESPQHWRRASGSGCPLRKRYAQIFERANVLVCHSVTVTFMSNCHAQSPLPAVLQCDLDDVKMNELHLPWHSYGRWRCPAIYPCSTIWQWSQCLASTTFRISGEGWEASAISCKATESAFRRILNSECECFPVVRRFRHANLLLLAILKFATPPPASVTSSTMPPLSATTLFLFNSSIFFSAWLGYA